MLIINPVHIFAAGNGFIVLLFVPHKKGDHQAANDADGKAGDIDQQKILCSATGSAGLFSGNF
jgi:hypothetical protein